MPFVHRPPRPEELGTLAEHFSEAYLENLLAIPMPLDEARLVTDAVVRQPVLAGGVSPTTRIGVLEDTDAAEIAGGVVVNLLPSMKLAQGVILWVKDRYRGQNLAKDLVQHAWALGREGGAVRFDIGVVHAQDHLIRMYERWGFVRVARNMGKRL